MKIEYGDVRKMLDLNKKYPNLFNGKMTYEELHQYLKEDFIPLTEIQAKFANVSHHNSINIYGYRFTRESFELFKKYSDEYDKDENSKKKFDEIIAEIYQLYLESSNNKESADDKK